MLPVLAAVLCLVSLSRSAPLACEDLVRPLDQVDLSWQGRWALVAGSLNDSAAEDALKKRLSVTIDLHNTSYTQAYRLEDQCHYHTYNISVEENTLRIRAGRFNFTGTFFHTPCPHCVLLRLGLEAPKYASVDYYLFSRSRQVEQKHMDDYRAQVECLNLPPPVIMDPNLELCPGQSDSEPTAKPEEKTQEGQEA